LSLRSTPLRCAKTLHFTFAGRLAPQSA